MELRALPLPGAFEVRPHVHIDARGSLVKLVHRPTLEAHGLAADFPEVLFTTSATGVVRGLHFQRPPHDHTKLIHCIQGEVMDVLVDLRRGSPTFKKHVVVELNGQSSNGLYLPSGLAHGFYTRAGPATLMYHMTHVHAPDADMGVRWDSVAAPWPTPHPVVSDRDASLPPLVSIDSPFDWIGEAEKSSGVGP